MAKRLLRLFEGSDRLLRADYHVHSTFSDDAVSSLAENIAAAEAARLDTLRLIDHVRQSTTWVPEFISAVAAEPKPEFLDVLTGVEAKMMDVTGRLDIPSDLVVGPGGVDCIVIADHQFPGSDGPWSPDETKARLTSGELTPAGAIEMLFSAYTAAMRAHPGSQLAHPFSILPKIGLTFPHSVLQPLQAEAAMKQFVAVVIETETLVEVNQKWGVSSMLPLRALLEADRIVPASDAHDAADVGVYGREVREPIDWARRPVPGER